MRHSNSIWKRQERSRLPYYRRAERSFKISLNRQLTPVIEYLGQVGDLVDYGKVKMLINEAPIWESMEYVYTTAGSDEAMRLYNQYVTAEGIKRKFDQTMKDLLKATAAEKVTAITNLTKDKAVDIIRKSLAENLGDNSATIGRNMARDLRRQGARMSNWRAIVIARTETATAMDTGKHIAMNEVTDATGLLFEKVWLATGTGDHRDWHTALEQTTVEQDGRFMVPRPSGGYDMMLHPHDPTASVENIVNCRCTFIERPINGDLDL